MVWTARIDVAPLKHFVIVAVIATAWIALSIIVGIAGVHSGSFPPILISILFLDLCEGGFLACPFLPSLPS